MPAFLKKNLSEEEVKTYLYRNLEVLREDFQGNVYCRCPECGKADSRFSVNIRKGVFNCFHASCQYRGTLKDLEKRFGPIGSSEYDYLPDSSLQKESKSEENSIPISQISTEGYFRIWNTCFRPLSDFEFKLIYQQWKLFFSSRNISMETLNRLGVRYCENPFPEEKDYGRLHGYLGFPYFNWFTGNLEYFQFRISPGADSVVKWKFPKTLDSWNKKLFLYSPGINFQLPFLILCESILDSIRVGTNAISLGGSSLSEDQLKLVNRISSGKRIYLLLDGDTPGKLATQRIAELMMKFSFSRIFVPPEEYFRLGKDPDELSDPELKELFLNFVEFF